VNQQARREYSSITKRQFNRFERSYLRRLYNALRGQITGFVDILHERGLEAAYRQLDSYLLNDKIGDVLHDLYIEAGLFFARKTYREINKSVKQKAANFGFSEEWTKAIIDFLRQNLLSKAVIPITAETKAQILGVLDKATKEGWGIEKIAAELQSPELLLWRARLIARTELAHAAHFGGKAAEESSDWETEKEWIASNDDKTRNSHRLIDGEVIDNEARFQVPRKKGGYDMMEGPGDPKASAENVINCRCSLSVRAKRDSNGNLVPKAKRIVIIQPGQNPIRQTITV
jgi:hypothetical protein